jgi:hypothetical protein
MEFEVGRWLMGGALLVAYFGESGPVEAAPENRPATAAGPQALALRHGLCNEAGLAAHAGPSYVGQNDWSGAAPLGLDYERLTGSTLTEADKTIHAAFTPDRKWQTLNSVELAGGRDDLRDSADPGLLKVSRWTCTWSAASENDPTSYTFTLDLSAQIPDVRGKTVTEAEEFAKARGLTIGTRPEDAGDDWRVLEQDQDRGTTVAVTESEAPALVITAEAPAVMTKPVVNSASPKETGHWKHASSDPIGNANATADTPSTRLTLSAPRDTASTGSVTLGLSVRQILVGVLVAGLILLIWLVQVARRRPLPSGPGSRGPTASTLTFGAVRPTTPPYDNGIPPVAARNIPRPHDTGVAHVPPALEYRVETHTPSREVVVVAEAEWPNVVVTLRPVRPEARRSLIEEETQ